MKIEEPRSPTEDTEPTSGQPAQGEPETEDVEGHSLVYDYSTARELCRAREEEIQRQAERRRREHEVEQPSQPRGRR